MIPDFIIISGALWPVLPQGVHEASFNEFTARFVYNERRKTLCEGLLRGITNLFQAGCMAVYVDGSYVTAKPEPNDYDLCWDIEGVKPTLIDPIFHDFSNKRQRQKQKYGGEYFPFTVYETPSNSFLEFFQTDKTTGGRKGIIKIKSFI